MEQSSSPAALYKALGYQTSPDTPGAGRSDAVRCLLIVPGSHGAWCLNLTYKRESESGAAHTLDDVTGQYLPELL